MTRIGILGGGQLGRMTIEESLKLLCDIEVLSPDDPAPAAGIATRLTVAGLMDGDAIRALGHRCDVLSYEIEHVDVDALRDVEAAGTPVIPSPAILDIIQDKAAQKRLLDRAGIPTADWALIGNGESAATTEAVIEAAARVGGFPVVQKAGRGGYDGRGVAVLRGPDDARPVAAGGRLLTAPGFVEALVPFTKELAVVVARDRAGHTAAWPCVEMIFDPRANLCDSVLMPAREPPEVLAEAQRVALAVVDALGDRARTAGDGAGGAGIFAVELFLTPDGRVLVNETAPRPHNSGHVTMEACATSQFSQYYRILAGYPLGSVELLRPAMMVNRLGEPGAVGEPCYEGLGDALGVPGVTVHLYGKSEAKPFRKMGHLTAIGATAEEAVARAEEARSRIRITGA